MIKGLNVSNEGRLIGGILDEVRARGVQMIRSDLMGVSLLADIPALVSEIVAAGMEPLAVLRPDQMAGLPPLEAVGVIDVEPWNEPDIGTPPTPRMSPQQYAVAVHEAVATCPPGHRIWAGVISNLVVDRLNWLKASVSLWPPGVHVSAHWYPPKGSMPPRNQHQGFGSRVHEVERLKAVIADRPWGISEVGYNDAEGLTPQQVADATRWERDFWQEQGAAFCCFYQLNCGPSTHYLDHFGWRTVDGAWLPVSGTFQEAT